MAKIGRLPRAEFGSREYRTVRTPWFLLKTKKNDGKGARIGVVAGKSVEKTAVKRNFWKRQSRAVLQSVLHGDQDALVIVYPGVRAATRKQFRDALMKTAKQYRRRTLKN